MDIILYLLSIIQYLYQQNCWLINLICRYIPLKQWAFDDSHSPKYQKFKVDELPKVQIIQQEWDWRLLIPYFERRYGVKIKPVSRRKECDIPEDCSCPSCGAPQPYLYRNNGKAGQLKCKVCNTNFSPDENRFAKQFTLRCPHCGKALVAKKERKHFIIHKCVNPKCPYYLHNLKKVDKDDLEEDYGKNKYKLHYIYRQFTIDFFSMDVSTLPKNASSLKFSKHNAHVMSLCLTLHINLGLSLRKTSQALKDLYNIQISHQQIANYCKTAAICIKPFVDQYPYRRGEAFVADETYIKVRGIKTYVWLIMNAACRSIIGYQVSDNRGVGPCILAMRMAFQELKKLPENFKFIADGYSAYPLAAMEFEKKFGQDFSFQITQVIGLTNNDAFVTDENGSVTKETNHAGGILGGMSDGSPIVFRAAIKPTPSVASTQKTINKNGEEIEINIKGRHDPIIVPRAVVVVESMAAITIFDAMLSNMSARMDGIKDFYQK